jgi:hypothetical protein
MVGEMETNREPIIGISRLRMGTDGHGIRTLVAFHGCCLSCKYCLNPKCLGDSLYITTDMVFGLGARGLLTILSSFYYGLR